MADLRRIPPGRAGRLWLMARLRAARSAVDLLDRKLNILRFEQERCALRSRRTADEWRRCWPVADAWGTRAAVLGGRRELQLVAAEGEGDAQVDVVWSGVMGVRFPADASCRHPEPTAGARGPGTAALAEASVAYRAALAAGVAHAAAEAARRTIDAEVATTRRRRRAVAERLVPRLEAGLGRLMADIEEAERAETVRLRWAAGRSAERELS